MQMNVLWAHLSIICIKMKNRFVYILLSIAAVLSAGCHGTIDQQEKDALELTADCLSVPADGSSKVKFTVTCGDADVTGQAEIECLTTGQVLEGNAFVAETEGKYVFVARYDSQLSESVEVTATFVSRFERNVCVMEFTGQWCSWCPEGAQLLEFLVTEIYPGQVCALAFHNEDDFAIQAEADLRARFTWDSYPAFVTDMRESGNLSGDRCRLSIEKSLYETLTHTSVAVSSEVVGETCQISARLFPEKSMNYRMAAYAVEDRIVAWQTSSSNTISENYVHRHVVRKMLSSSISGDDMGNLSAGQEKAHTYELELDSAWNLENMTVVVLAIDENGHVNNVAQCPLNGGSVEYEMKK